MASERTIERAISDLLEIAKGDTYTHWLVEKDEGGAVAIHRSFGGYKADGEVTWPCGESGSLHEAMNQFLDEIEEQDNG